MGVPKNLKIYSFKDFCIRCEDIYQYFWESYAPFFDIATYRDYIYDEAPLSNSKIRQENCANVIWSFLMGDILLDDLYNFASMRRAENEGNN